MIIGWVAVHGMVFYLSFASGVLIEILLTIARGVLFPGTSLRAAGQEEMFGWTGFLQTGVILAGAAGVPAGLAVFWRGRRKLLLGGFVILFVGGLCFELYTVYAVAISLLPPPH